MADRIPLVKICGVTDADGVLAAVRAGADAIGLNLVPGTPRALDLDEAVALARLARSAGSVGRPRVVVITADAGAETLALAIATLDPDAVQLSGDERPETVAGLGRAAWKVLHLPAGAPADVAAAAAVVVERGRAFLAAGAERILLDTAGGPHPGGTGIRAATELAAAVARELPVILAGGLDPATVADAVRTIPAIGVDVASGVEAPRDRRRAAAQGPAAGRPLRQACPRGPPRPPAWPGSPDARPPRPPGGGRRRSVGRGS